MSRLPDSLVGWLRARFDCHLLADLDAAALAALAPRLRGMVAKGESVVARELIVRLPNQNSTAENIGHNDVTWHTHRTFVAVLRTVKVAFSPPG